MADFDVGSKITVEGGATHTVVQVGDDENGDGKVYLCDDDRIYKKSDGTFKNVTLNLGTPTYNSTAKKITFSSGTGGYCFFGGEIFYLAPIDLNNSELTELTFRGGTLSDEAQNNLKEYFDFVGFKVIVKKAGAFNFDNQLIANSDFFFFEFADAYDAESKTITGAWTKDDNNVYTYYPTYTTEGYSLTDNRKLTKTNAAGNPAFTLTGLNGTLPEIPNYKIKDITVDDENVVTVASSLFAHRRRIINADKSRLFQLHLGDDRRRNYLRQGNYGTV